MHSKHAIKNFVRIACAILPLFFIAAIVYAQVIDGTDMVSGFEKRRNIALQRLSTKQNSDTSRANALIDLLSTAYFQKQRTELFTYWEEAYHLCTKLQYRKGLSFCYFWKANYSRGSNDLPGFHLYTDSSILYSENADPAQWAKVHRLKGLQYQQEENYYAALKHYFKALEYYETVKSENTLHLYQNISSAYLNLRTLDKAEKYAKDGVVLAEESWVPVNIKLQAFSSLASVYLQNNNTNDARIYLDKVRPYMPDTVEQAVTSDYYLDRGLLYFKEQHYDSSSLYYSTGYRFATLTKHQINQYGALNYLFKNSLKLGNIKQAAHYANEGMKVAAQSGMAINMITALYNLSDYYHAAGNEKKAFEFLQHGTALKDSFSQATNYANINHLFVLYETDKKQDEITRLKIEKTSQDTELKRRAVLNGIYIVLAIAFLIIAILGISYYKTREKFQKQKQKIQKQKIAELEKDKQLVAVDAMLKGQAEERSRVAKDLHDGLGSMLSGAKHSFSDLRGKIPLSGEMEERFDRSIELLDNTIADLKKVAQNLMPATLSKFGLAEAVKDFCQSIESSTGIKLMYQQMGVDRMVEKTAEIFSYRIIQELVNNSVKYAAATEIFVELIINENTINITVEDDGTGFDKSSLVESTGSGMKNIQYRVDYLNGKLEIDTAPGEGTSVYITLNA